MKRQASPPAQGAIEWNTDLQEASEGFNLTTIGMSSEAVTSLINSICSSQDEFDDVLPTTVAVNEPVVFIDENKITLRLEFTASMFKMYVNQSDLYGRFKYDEYMESIKWNTGIMMSSGPVEEISDEKSSGALATVLWVMCRQHENYMKAMEKICQHIGLRRNKLIQNEGDCLRSLQQSIKIRASFGIANVINDVIQNKGVNVKSEFSGTPFPPPFGKHP
jgi:hypothetical protein